VSPHAPKRLEARSKPISGFFKSTTGFAVVTRLVRVVLLVLLPGVFTSAPALAQIPIGPGGLVSENFSSLGENATATLPTGWKVDKSTTVRAAGSYSAALTATERLGGANLTASAGNGIYNFGSSATDRAVGGLSSSSASKSVNLYVALQNTNGVDIPSLTISYSAERYRNGSNAAGFSIQLYYSTDGATWTSAGPNFLSSFAANADNNGSATVPMQTIAVASQPLSVSVPAGSTLYLAWNYSVTAGSTTSNAQALGVTDIQIAAGGSAGSGPVISTFAPTSGFLGDSVTINGSNFGSSPTVKFNGTTATSVSVNPAGTQITATVPSGASTGKITVEVVGEPTATSATDFTVIAPGTPIINLSTNAITGLRTSTGSPSSATNYVVSGTNLGATPVTVTPDSALLEVGTNGADFASSASLSPSGGTVSNTIFLRVVATNVVTNFTAAVNHISGTASNTLAVSGAITNPAPSLVLNPTNLSGFTTTTNTPSTNQSFTVVGSNLTTNVSITAPGGFEVANDASTWGTNTSLAQIGGSASGTISVRMSALSASGPRFGTVLVGSSGLTNRLAVSGSVPVPNVPGQIYWNFDTATPTAGTGGEYAAWTFLPITQNNNNGTTPLLDTTSASSGYTNPFNVLASGTTNAGTAARIGAFNAASNAFFEVQLVVPGGATTSITNVSFGSRSTTTGPAAYSIRSSADNFVSDVFTNSMAANGTWAMYIAPVSITLSNGTNTIRIYGYNGSGSAGANTANWRIDDLTVAIASLGPTLSVNPTNISGLQSEQGSASGAPYDSYILNGTAITNSVTISAPVGVELSFASNGTGFSNSLAIVSAPPGGTFSTNVFVRIAAGASVGSFTNFITNSTIGGAGNAIVQVSGQVVAAGTPVIEPANNTRLSGFTTVRPAASTNQQVTVSGLNLPTNLTILPPAGWEISATNSNNPTTNSIVLGTNPAGVVSNTLLFVRLASSSIAASYTDSALRLVSGTNTNNVLLSGTVTDPAPSIAVSTNTLPAFNSTTNVASAAQSFFAQGTNLSANITVTAPTGFSVALTSNNADFGTSVTLTNASGLATNREIFVRMNASAVTNTLSARNVTLATTGASDQVSVSGTITASSSTSLALNGTLTNFSTPQGVASAAQSFVVQGSGLTSNVTVSSLPANLEFATNTSSGYSTSLVLSLTNGALSNTVFARIPSSASPGGPTQSAITAASGSTNATLGAITTVSSNAGPFILANPTALSGFSTTEGTPSTNQTFKVAATNLTSGPLNVAASTNYEVSLDGTNFSAAVNLTPVAPAGAIVPKAGPVTYNDATNDIAPGISTGGGTLDIVKMEVSDTATDLVFSLTINGNTTTPNDWGNFMIGMANGKSAGATNATGNGWNRPINMITPTNGGMTHWIGSWVNGPGGGAQLWSYNGTAWQEQTATPPAFVRTAGTQSLLTYTVPLANLGLAVGDTLFFDAYSSGGGATDGAVDALSNTNISITTWASPYTSSTNTGISSYKVGGSGGGGNVAETTIYVRLRGAAAANPADGAVTLSGGGAPSKTVTLNGVVLPRPVVTPTASLAPFVADLGSSSAAQSFTFTATNLVGEVTVTAPTGYEISKTTNGTYASLLTYSPAEAQPGPATNWVRLATNAPAGIVFGNISLASQGAVTNTVFVTGRVTGDPVLSVAPSTLTNFFTGPGTSSASQSFVVRGVDLDGDIFLAATNANSWEIRDPADGLYKSAVTLAASNSVPVTFAQDSASNSTYAGGWTNGSDGGAGFGPWNIQAGGTATATIGNPADAGITGMNSNSFALQGTNGYVTVQRGFDAPLLPGDTFSLQFGNNFDTGGPGNKGVNIFAGGFDQANQLVNVNMGGSATITINGQPMFAQYGTNAVTLNFQYVAPGQLRVFGTGRDGTETYDQTFVIAGAPDRFSLYAGDLAADQLAQRVLYANNFAITTGGAGPSVNPTEILVRIKAGAPLNPALEGSVTATTIKAAPAVVSLAGVVSDTPEITRTESLLPFFAVQGFASETQTFKVGGNNLAASGVLVAPPADYQVSLDGVAWSSSVTVARTAIVTPQQDVFIRIAPSALVGTPGGNILLTSAGAATVNIPVAGQVAANGGPQLTANPASLPAFSAEVGTNSAAQSFILTGQALSNSVVLAAPSGFVLSTNATTFVSNSTITPPPSGFISNTISVRMAGTSAGIFTGNVAATSGAANTSVAVQGTVFAVGAQIAASPTNLSGFTTVENTPSTAQSFLASGRNLGTTNLVATASAGYEVSTNSIAFFGSAVTNVPVAGAVAPLPLYVRIAANAPVTNALAGTVTLSSGSAGTVTVALNGKVDPLRPPSVTLVAPSNNPTIIAPGATVRLRATATDTNVSGGAGTLATFQFLTNGVPIPGAVTNNVLSPATLQFDWTPALTDLPATVSARAVDTDNLTNESTSVLVRYTEPGEPVIGFAPPVANPVNTQIEAVAPATNGAFYVGGNFTNFVRTNGSVVVTNATTRVARILADGAVDPEFVTETGPNNVVRALLPSARNKGLYIGGAFASVSGAPRSALARLAVGRAGIVDGTLDEGFAPVLAGGSVVVNAIVEQYDGKVLVGGSFSSVDGVSSPNIARLNADGTVDTTFVAPAPSGAVNALALQPDGKILLGGAFTQVAGQSRRGLARLNLDGTLDTGFIVGAGVKGTVNSVAVAPDGSIYAGGQFSSYNGSEFYNNLVKLSAGGVLEGRFNYSLDSTGGLNGAVNSVQVRPTGEVLVCGLFTQISNSVLPVAPTAVGRIVQLKPDGSIDPDFNPGGTGANNTVRASATLANGNLVLVGAFSTYNGQSIPRILVLSGYSATTSIITSPWFLTVGAGEEFDFAFTSSGSAPYAIVPTLLPRGVKTNTVAGRLSGIALDSGGFDMSVASTAPTGGAGTPSLFRLYVVPQIVSYEAWKRVWFTPTEQTNSSVSGPAVSAGNPSGQPNFTVYALSGGDPRKEGPSILPVTGTELFENQRFLSYAVTRYPLADASCSAQLSGDLTNWGTNFVTITNTPSFFRVRPEAPMSSTNRQFFRLEVTSP
jgi:uncharacterized delta-60 repeat protein